jgi:hypothetical protein
LLKRGNSSSKHLHLGTDSGSWTSTKTFKQPRKYFDSVEIN